MLLLNEFKTFLDKNNFSNSRLDITRKGSDLCTFGVGGVVSAIFYPENTETLSQSLVFFKEKGILYRILGQGSNIVIPDQGIEDLVIKLPSQNIKELNLEEIRSLKLGDKINFNLAASSSLMSLSRQFTDLGLSGLEFAAGIPATLGGAAYMNAGAHGSQIFDVISSMTIVDTEGVTKNYNINDLNFSYRKSGIKQGELITQVNLSLEKKELSSIKAHRKGCLEYRKKTQPLTYPSAGSVFKNISKDLSAAKIIDDLGLKGLRFGTAIISPMHANWIIVDKEVGKSEDIKNLVEVILEKVYKGTGVELQTEIIFW